MFRRSAKGSWLPSLIAAALAVFAAGAGPSRASETPARPDTVTVASAVRPDGTTAGDATRPAEETLAATPPAGRPPEATPPGVPAAAESAMAPVVPVALPASPPDNAAGSPAASIPAASDALLSGVPAPGTTPLAVPAAGPGEVTHAADADTPPEGMEKAPVLVGPDDDKLLEEVEKHVNIAPAEPAIKIAEPEYDIPLELNAKVLDYVEIFQTTRRRSFEAGLVRSRKYEAMMKPIFRELGIPTDLYYLALIESGYNPKAYSYARAMGIWQFISSTGKLYGLRRTDWLDERRDPEKSTRAAARHLKDLYDELGSWPLALAAYNAGKGRVQRAIAKAGTNDFWSLQLPAQTRNYVPAFFAAVIISRNPERYGFQPEYEELQPTEVIEVGGGTRLSLVAALCRTSVETIQNLNPELRKTTVPPGGKYALKIPAGRVEELSAGLSRIPEGKATAGLSDYRVASGDTLFSIAQRFGTSIQSIREANRLGDGGIRAGQTLVIPGQRSAAAAIPRAPGRIVVSAAVPESYRVASGDNPWAIARRFGITLDDLLAWNGLEPGAVLSIGQTLALREPTAAMASGTRTATASRTYEVRRGDNLWQIARRFETSVGEIQRLNGIAAATALKPGDRLVLP